MFGMALIIVFQGGKDGLSIHPLLPSASPNGASGLVTGFVFAALSFVGSKRATLRGGQASATGSTPRAIFLSVLVGWPAVPVLLWAEVIGLGTEAANELDGTSLPWNDLAATYAPWINVVIWRLCPACSR